MANKDLKYTITVDEKGAIKSIKSFEKSGNKASKNVGKGFTKLSKTSKKTTTDMTKHWKKFAGVLLASFAFKEIINGFQSVIKATSDLQEVTGKFEVVFKGQMAAANRFVDTLVDGYAMSTREARQFLSSIQDLLVPMGVSASAAATLSNEVVKLAADLGSFNNLPTQQVIDDMQSALVGNYETMKKYGVVLRATLVDQKALDMGLVATKKQLTAAHRAQAAYKLMLDGSKAAVGDMARTMGNYANQIKQLNANLEEFKVMIGKHILPIVNEYVTALNDWYKLNEFLVDQKIAEWVDGIKEASKKLWDIISYDPAILEFGLIGLLIWGRKGAMVVGGIAHSINMLRQMAEAMEKVGEGKMTLGEFSTSDFKELEKLLKEINLGDEVRLQTKITELIDKRIEKEIELLHLKGLVEDKTEEWDKKQKYPWKFFTAYPIGKQYEELKDLQWEIDLISVKLFEARRELNKFLDIGSLKDLKKFNKEFQKLELEMFERTVFFGSDMYDDKLDNIKSFNKEMKKLFVGGDIDQPISFGEEATTEKMYSVIRGMDDVFAHLIMKPGEYTKEELEQIKYMDDQILEMNAARLSEQIAQEEEAIQKTKDGYMNLAEGVTNSITNIGMSIRGVIQNTHEWGDVLVDTLNMMSDAFMQFAMDMAKLKMMEFFAGIVAGMSSSGLGSSSTIRGGQGGGYGFAKGGIITRPTLFPMARGGTGLAGEEAPEAIMPLKRGPDGNLGVEGSGGGGVTNIIIQALDSQSFFDAMQRNPDALINVISKETDKGNRKLMSSINRAGAFA